MERHSWSLSRESCESPIVRANSPIAIHKTVERACLAYGVSMLSWTLINSFDAFQSIHRSARP